MTLPELRAALEATCPTQMQTVNDRLMVSLNVPLASLQLVREAAEKHLATLPRTKTVEVYSVHCTSVLDTDFVECGLPLESVAAHVEANLRKGHKKVRVTGPYRAEVPA